MELYIASSENAEFYEPLKIVNCHILEKKGWFTSSYFLHIETEQSVPLFGLDQYGISQKMGANFILASRYIGKNIKELKTFPVTVNVCIPKNNNFSAMQSTKNLVFYAIADLYDNIEDARNHKIK